MADYVKLRTNVTTHVRFLEAGAVARDLYVWAMAWSGWQETDGDVPMTILLASPWGAGGRKNIKVAKKLVEVGLWERTDEGYRICKWAEQGNVTKADLVVKRQFDRDRKAKQRAPKSEPCPSGTPSGTPTVTPLGVTPDSLPLSLPLPPSGSSLGRDPDPDRSPMPEWFAIAAGTAVLAIGGGEIDALPARWASYASSRERKGWAKNHGDAVGWLSDVVRRERRDAASKPKRTDTRQPLRDPNPEWLRKTGTGDDL